MFVALGRPTLHLCDTEAYGLQCPEPAEPVVIVVWGGDVLDGAADLVAGVFVVVGWLAFGCLVRQLVRRERRHRVG